MPPRRPARAGARRPARATVAVALAAAAAAIAGLAAAPRPLARALVREDGPVEQATAALLAADALLALLCPWSDRAGRALGAAVLLTGALREFDVHARFTPVAIDKRWTLGFFLSPRVDAPTKAAVALALAGLAAAVVALVVREGPRFARALRAGAPGAISLAAALLTLVAAQGLDEASAALRALGPERALLGRLAEEVLELAGAALVLVALAQARGPRSSRAGPGAAGGGSVAR